MSDASQSSSLPPIRPLREEERDLICFLLSGTRAQASVKETLRASRVREMTDGSMGSIRFVQAEPRAFGKVLTEAQYVDADGVCVSIAINCDNKGDLFEVDFWKVDFSPLKRYPKPSDLRLESEVRRDGCEPGRRG